jgi:homospermidine synthase
MATHMTHAKITGPVVMIGFGSIGRGTLPLIQRHIQCDPNRFTVIDPNPKHSKMCEAAGVSFLKEAVTKENYRTLLAPLLACKPGEQAFVVNLSVDVSSVAMMELCQELNALYIDTVVEPWLGYYTNANLSRGARADK